MKKSGLKRILSAFLSTTMIIGSVAFTPFETMAAVTIAGGGWYETIFAELTGTSDSAVTAVSWTGTNGSGSLTGEDLQYLVRDANGKVRIDIPGVKPGTYTLTVTAGGADYKKENIEVYEYDRSGYAHWNRTDFTSEGVGAYKDDGTLKANAKVLYVTNDNKDTVTVSTSDGSTTVTGIGNILNSAGGSPKKDDHGNVVSTVVNTNQDIILKLAQDNTPLVVRIIGDVQAPQGLTAYDSNDYGGTEGDNGFMARMQSGKNVTIEGIGPDATINGWGLHYICQSSHPELGKSFELRNIIFRNVPEDCVGMEGQQSGSEITAGVERCWIHHCEFYKPTIEHPAESDKNGGDGACDFKRGQYFTNSYCIYDGYHKTNLVGSSDSSLQYNMTYHHNHWKNCEARAPLGRQANIHMYNNYFEGQSDFTQQTRANCYIFSEYNLFYQCKNPQQVKGGGPIKSYMDSLSGCIDAMDATVVKDKSQVVSSSNEFSAFDTDPSLSYIPSGDYLLDESITTVKAKALSQAGVMKADPIMDPEDVNTSMIQGDRQPTGSVPLPYDKALNSTYVTSKNMTVDNIIFNVSKTDSSSLTVGGNETGQDIVFNVNTAVDISITDGGASYPVILMNDSGEEIITGTGTAYNVPAGTYFIQSSGFQPAKGDSPAKFKESKITHLKITPFDASAPTVAEPTTQTTTQAKESSSQTTTKKPDTNPEPDPETTTKEQSAQPGGGTDADNTFHSFMDDGITDPEDFFAFENASKPSDKKGSVTYKGKEYTKCLKIESTTHIVFSSDDGKVIVVTKDGTGFKLDDTELLFEKDMEKVAGEEYAYEFPVKKGIHTISKGGSGEDHIYYIEYVPDNPVVKPEPGTAILSVESQTASKGETVKVPIKISGITDLTNYTITLNYDPGSLTYRSVENGTACKADTVEGKQISNGKLSITGVNSAKTIEDGYLFYVNFTANSSTDITLNADVLKSSTNTDINSSVTSGSVTVTSSAQSLNGDANLDQKVDDADAVTVLMHISQIRPITSSVALSNADCDGIEGIDMGDVIWLLNYEPSSAPQPPAPSGSFDWTPTTNISKNDVIYSTSKVKITAAQQLNYDGEYTGKTDLPAHFGDIEASHYVKTNGENTKLNGRTYRLAAKIEAQGNVTVSFAICLNAGKSYEFIDYSTNEQITKNSSPATTYDMLSITLKAGDVVYLCGEGTNPEIYGINVDPKDGAVEEPSSEATTKASVATTKAPEKETSAESTTSANMQGVISSSHELSPSSLNNDSFFTKTGDFSQSDNNKIRLTNTNSLSFKVASGANVYITAAHASSTDKNSRTIYLKKEDKTAIGQHDYAQGAAEEEVLFGSGLNAGTYVITASNHMNVTSIRITFDNVDPKPQQSTEKPTETTTAKVEKPTQTTTLAPLPSGGDVSLSTPPSKVVATVKTASELTNALKNMSGGTVYVDAPEIDISSTLNISVSNGALVGKQQSDGTYPVLNFADQKPSDSAYGIKLTGDNNLIQNLIIENAGDNGIAVQGANNNKIEHCIIRYSYDTGIQLDDQSKGNVIRYCYSYRNCDVDNAGANADGFAPKLGCSDTRFEYCFSWDNADDGWDSYDKEEQTPFIEYYHSACWNNGNPQVFTGEYDFNNKNPLDKKMKSIGDLISSDSSFESNYNKGIFDTSKAKISGKSVSAWLGDGNKDGTANKEMNGNGFKFGSAYTASDGSVTRTIDHCLAFDHKAKNFDNNNSTKVNINMTNAIAFNAAGKPNYQLPDYIAKSWSNVYGWNGGGSDKLPSGKTVTKPSNTAELESEIYSIRDQIISYCYANKFPDGITFDDVFSMVK